MGFGLVSMLMDVVYEGALSVQGPLLASLGATAATVGLISGLGEATSLMGRLVTGPLADRVGRYWLFAIAGYAITALAVPAMGLRAAWRPWGRWLCSSAWARRFARLRAMP